MFRSEMLVWACAGLHQLLLEGLINGDGDSVPIDGRASSDNAVCALKVGLVKKFNSAIALETLILRYGA